jgi:hypothetical protein
MHRATWLLYLFHRWAGIVLCLILALWFFSGVFMMYVDFPQQLRAERLKGEAPLDAAAVRLSPGEAARRLVPADFRIQGTPSRNEELEQMPPIPLSFRDISLASYLGRPAYTFTPENGAQPRTVFADTGDVLRDIDARLAIRAAADFAVRSGLIGSEETSRLLYRGIVQTDQWSVSSALNGHRPLHVISLGDEHDTELYVSSRTGQVVRDTNARERALNYLGSVTHWIYPTVLRKYPDAWEWVVDILAAVASIMAVAGMWIALSRWRFKRRPGQSRIPYRGLMRWHYITGAIFGVIVVTWAFSGLLSLNPGNLNPSRTPTRAQKQVLGGPPLPLDAWQPPGAAHLPADVRELKTLQYRGQPLWLATMGNGGTRLVAGGTGAHFDAPQIVALAKLAPELMPAVPVAQVQVLDKYDDYYYSRNPERGEKPLPVIRVQFADSGHTWFHIDVATGQLLDRTTSTNRVFRWLYNGLHSLDIRWLWERRPLWDIVVITLCGGGLFLSIIGVIAGIRRLRFDLARSQALGRQASSVDSEAPVRSH